MWGVWGPVRIQEQNRTESRNSHTRIRLCAQAFILQTNSSEVSLIYTQSHSHRITRVPLSPYPSTSSTRRLSQANTQNNAAAQAFMYISHIRRYGTLPSRDSTFPTPFARIVQNNKYHPRAHPFSSQLPPSLVRLPTSNGKIGGPQLTFATLRSRDDLHGHSLRNLFCDRCLGSSLLCLCEQHRPWKRGHHLRLRGRLEYC